jgi:DNA gyrase subunit A
MRRADGRVPTRIEGTDDDEEAVAEGALSQERYAEMSAAEDLILTITEGGSGKLSSSHDYPVRGRGGQGVAAMDKAMRGGDLVASFPVEMDDQIMLATSTGQSIRCPVDGISFRSRGAGRGQGVQHRRGRTGRLGRLDRRHIVGGGMAGSEGRLAGRQPACPW